MVKYSLFYISKFHAIYGRNDNFFLSIRSICCLFVLSCVCLCVGIHICWGTPEEAKSIESEVGF